MESDHCDHGAALRAATARLLGGAGLCTVAIRDSSDARDAVTPLAHRREGDVLVLTAAVEVGSGFPDAAGLQVVVMIDEYAPVLPSRVHVGSIHAYGTVDAVTIPGDPHVSAAEGVPGGAGSGTVMVELRVRPGALAVNRLGRSEILEVHQVADVEVDPVAEAAFHVVDEVHARFASGLATVTRHDGSGGAGPLVIDVDATGIVVLASTEGRSHLSRFLFRERVSTPDAVLREVGRLVATAA